MTGDGPKIVIEGTREDWPGGPRTLTPRDPSRDPNRQTFWFGAELDPDGSQVWFRIASEAVRRMGEQTPRARGDRLVDALLAWLMTPDRQPDGTFAHFRRKPTWTSHRPHPPKQ